MTVLYIDRKTMRITRESKAIVLWDNQQRLTTVPIHMLERIIIHANAQVDVFLFHYLANAGVSTILLGRGQNKVALINGPAAGDASRRIRQYRLYDDDSWRRHWSARLVRLKILGQRRVLHAMMHTRPDQRFALHKALKTCAKSLSRIEPGITSLASLRGFEGAAAQGAFSAYCAVFPPSMNFQGRNRRPPRDPVNALLSLAYTMLNAEAMLACHRHGLDPAIGFYHDLAHGRDSLASDLIEAFRPSIDRWVWNMFRDRTLRNENFSIEHNGCRLNKPGRAIFYQHWERQAVPLRKRLARAAIITVKTMQLWSAHHANTLP